MTDTLLQDLIPSVDLEIAAPEGAELAEVPMREFDQLDSKGEGQDRADAMALYQVYEGLAHLRSGSIGNTHKIAKLAIQHLWQQTRLPAPRHTHNKPLDYPWSKRARDLFFAGDTSGNLVFEHVRPLSTLVEVLFAIVEEAGDDSREKFYQKLVEEHSHLNFTVISNEDNTLLDKAGLRSKMVPGGPWARYELVGLMREQFKSITEDERFSPDMIVGHRGRFAKPKKVKARNPRAKKPAATK